MKNHQIQYESPVLQKNNSPTGGKWLSSAFCCPSQLLLLLVCQMQCIKGLIPLLLQSPVGSQSSHRKAEVQATSLVASHFCSKQCIRQAQLPFNESPPSRSCHPTSNTACLEWFLSSEPGTRGILPQQLWSLASQFVPYFPLFCLKSSAFLPASHIATLSSNSTGPSPVWLLFPATPYALAIPLHTKFTDSPHKLP